MADATRGGIFCRECRPISIAGTMDFAMIEILLVYQLVRNPVQGGCASPVVPQSVPRLARQAAMPRMHRRLMAGYGSNKDPRPVKRGNQTAFARLSRAHSRLEISK